MKKISTAVFAIILIASSGCSTASNDPKARQERYQLVQMQQAAPSQEITLVSVKTLVKQGESGNLTIHGKPGQTYTISAAYQRAGKAYITVKSTRAGSDGLAAWTWDVAGDTRTGSYTITVAGAGEKLTTAYTVIGRQ